LNAGDNALAFSPDGKLLACAGGFYVSGDLVRRIDLGFKPAGDYLDRSKATHWDGRNEEGESVSSGVYLHQMKAGGFSEIRRMTVLK